MTLGQTVKLRSTGLVSGIDATLAANQNLPTTDDTDTVVDFATYYAFALDSADYAGFLPVVEIQVEGWHRISGFCSVVDPNLTVSGIRWQAGIVVNDTTLFAGNAGIAYDRFEPTGAGSVGLIPLKFSPVMCHMYPGDELRMVVRTPGGWAYGGMNAAWVEGGTQYYQDVTHMLVELVRTT